MQERNESATETASPPSYTSDRFLSYWRPKVPLVGVAALGAAIWAGLFGLRLRRVPADWWQWRDDAVITLSHARNLVEFGTIGVSPGSDRVEGFSSPLQFALSAAFFAITDGGYGDFLDLQVALSVAISGAFTALILFQTGRTLGLTVGVSVFAATLLTTAAAAVTVSSWTTVGWLVSGMENPLYLALGLGLIWVSVTAPQGYWYPFAIGALVAVLGLARVEFPVLMIPVLAATAIVVATSASVKRRKAAIAGVVVIPVAVWGAVHLARWIYFGSFLPHTALVQDRVVGPLQLFTLAVMTALFGAVAWAMTRSGTERVPPTVWAMAAAFYMLLVMNGALQYLVPGSWAPVPVALTALIAATGAALAVLGRRQIRWPPDLLFAGLAFIPIAQFLVMGPARLEAFRVLSLAIPVAAVWLATGMLRLLAGTGGVTTTDVLPLIRDPLLPTLLVVAATVTGFGILTDAVRDMPWRISPSETKILSVSDAMQSNDLGGAAVPIVANPDLGKISFEKRAVIVDLGWLGDPLLTRVSRGRPDLETRYLNEIATPDVVQSHGVWSCHYKGWIDSEAFSGSYVLSDPTWESQGVDYDSTCPLGGRYAIWMRTGAEVEYSLTREIANAPDPVEVIERAVSECDASSEDIFRCQFVRRAVTRNSVMLRERGLLAEAVATFTSSPTAALDQDLLLRERGWADRAFAELASLADQESGDSPP